MQFSIDAFNIAPIQINDAWSVCNFVVSNEDRLKQYFPKTLEQNLTPDLSKQFVEKKVKQFNLKEEFLFTLKEKRNNAFAGLIYLKELDWNKKQGEFAYCIGYQFEGKGITSKAIETITKYTFSNLKLETLQIIAHKNNIPSIKVAKNNNFIWKKTLKNEYTPPNGKPMDMELYELYKN